MLPGERLVGGLTCSQVLADLSAYLDGELDAARKAQVEAHVSDCQNCARFGASLGRLLTEVRSRLSAPDQVPADIAVRLKAALRST